jgi:hypothetical protein
MEPPIFGAPRHADQGRVKLLQSRVKKATIKPRLMIASPRGHTTLDVKGVQLFRAPSEKNFRIA